MGDEKDVADVDISDVGTKQSGLATQHMSDLDDLSKIDALTPQVMSRQATINIGAIGHVAHGKSTVVKAITAIHTAKTKEEAKKNITIQLGYANAKIFKCNTCLAPACYQSGGSSSSDLTPCKHCKKMMKLVRHVSFVDCLAKPDMELLTADGWLNYAGAKAAWENRTLRVAGYNAAKEIVYETPTNFIDHDGAPESGMYTIGNGNWGLHVTGGHQLIVTAGYRDQLKPTVKATVAQIAAGKIPNGKGGEFTIADRMPYRLVNSVAGVAGAQDLEQVLTQPVLHALCPALATAATAEAAADIKLTFLKLFGLILGDGAMRCSNNGTSKAAADIIICAHMKPSDQVFLKKAADTLGLKLDEDYTWAECSTGKTALDAGPRINQRAWVNFFLAEYGAKYAHGLTYKDTADAARNAYARHIARGMMLEAQDFETLPESVNWLPDWAWLLPPAQAKALLCGLSEADGASSTNAKGTLETSNRVHTSGTYFRNQIARLALHAGCIAHSSSSIMECASGAVGRAARGDDDGDDGNTKPAIVATQGNWSCVHYSTPGEKNDAAANEAAFCRSEIKKDENYNGGSWCVTMPCGNIIVRRVSAQQQSMALAVGNCPGHDVLMATMLNGAAIMDAALLLVAANEHFPQPQTLEHLKAVEIMQLKYVLVLQNKIDLVKDTLATDQRSKILEKLKNTSALGSPIIPLSAQLKLNIDLVLQHLCHVPVPRRKVSLPCRMTIVRSFDVNKPGSKIEELKGGVAGGTVQEGVLRIGALLEIRPGEATGSTYRPFRTKAVSLNSEALELKYAIPGGLIACGTTLDPSLTRQNKLVGQVLGEPDKMPPIFSGIEVTFTLLPEVLGAKADKGGDNKEKKDNDKDKAGSGAAGSGYDATTRVANVGVGERMQVNIGSLTTLGIVIEVSDQNDPGKKTMRISLGRAVCAEIGESVAFSRKFTESWRLIGWGSIIGGAVKNVVPH